MYIISDDGGEELVAVARALELRIPVVIDVTTPPL